MKKTEPGTGGRILKMYGVDIVSGARAVHVVRNVMFTPETVLAMSMIHAGPHEVFHEALVPSCKQ